MEDPQNTPSKELFDEYVGNIEDGKFLKMLVGDQLIRSREKGECFYGFNEEEITFQPTFKVFVDKDYEYQPKRSPAWCDRIMWRSAPSFEKDVKCNKYTSAPKICSSDHKPVYAEYSVLTWKRAPAYVDDGVSRTRPNAILEFKNVQAKGLRTSDIGSASDPYLHFPRQQLLTSYQKSKRVKKTTEPKWPDKAIPSLNLSRTNVPFLQKALLLIQVRDYDMLSQADKLASTYLSLAPLVAEPGVFKNFKREMSFAGVGAGVLEGQYCLHFK